MDLSPACGTSRRRGFATRQGCRFAAAYLLTHQVFDAVTLYKTALPSTQAEDRSRSPKTDFGSHPETEGRRKVLHPPNPGRCLTMAWPSHRLNRCSIPVC